MPEIGKKKLSTTVSVTTFSNKSPKFETSMDPNRNVQQFDMGMYGKKRGGNGKPMK